MTKEKLEYWHDKLWELIDDMGTSPSNPYERRIWVNLLEAVGDAQVAIRLLYGDWKHSDSQAFKRHKPKRHATHSA